jgi:dihydroflavonol-4-reductase
MATVLLTGASGFLGIHIVQRLLDAGHQVRAFVRTPAKLHENLAMLGIKGDDPGIEVVTGDMTDPAAVRAAASGCDQTVHAAATFSYRAPREPARHHHGAGRGDRRRLHQHRARLVDRGAAPTRGDARPHTSPLGVGQGPYTQSKIDSERVARELQDSGAPVVIVNPGGVLGPNDPYLGESDDIVREILRGMVPTWPRGGTQWVDVRDAADVIVAALAKPGHRYLVPGETVAMPHETLRVVTGRRLPAVTMPVGMVLPILQLGYRTGWPFIPHAVEGARFIATNTRVDYSATVTDLGIRGRSLEESMRDTVRWLHQAGHISRRAAGRAVEA